MIRTRGYVKGVVILSPKDAFHLTQLLDKEARARALRGSNEDLIDALRSIAIAGEAWATYVNASKPAALSKAAANSNEWLTPARIATQLGVTPTRVRQAITEGRLEAVIVDRRYRITPAAYEAYKATR